MTDQYLDEVEEPDFEFATDNPELAAAAARITQGESAAAPDIPQPLDGPVVLPGGFVRRIVTEEGTREEDVRTAWVRELNGEDEERIAKAKLRDDLNAFVRAILESGVERLGDQTPTKDDFDALIFGDRDYLLMEIARATYGDELEYEEFVCYHCGEKVDFTVHISEDIPVVRLDAVAETSFEVRLTRDRVAVVRLPDVSVAGAVSAAETEAEANTHLIAASVDEIRGPKGTTRIDGDLTAAKRLSLRDRQTLITEMGKRMPGPQYNGVKFVHEDGKCDKEVRLTVTLADLFRGM